MGGETRAVHSLTPVFCTIRRSAPGSFSIRLPLIFRRKAMMKLARSSTLLMVVALLAFSGCESETEEATPPTTLSGLPVTIELTSPAFEPGDLIPSKYTADGQNISPPIRWGELPAGTRELVLIVTDVDSAGRASSINWIAYKIPADLSGLPEGIPQKPIITEPFSLMQGLNTWNRIGYHGPDPVTAGPHHYHFRLYALSEPLVVMSGLGQSDLLKAMAGKIISMGQLVGVYERALPGTPTTRPAR
jgi:Raf kinase inhibitor-like YbhB/YbcL family protein